MIAEDINSDPMDSQRFPADEWRLVESYPDNKDLGVTETLFATSNGYLGIRGNFEEGRPHHKNGTFLNGFHETWEIKHAENAFGFAKTGQTIIDVPSSHIIKLYVDDEPLYLSTADLQDYERSLDFRDATLRRRLIWRTPSGKRVKIESSRTVSFADRHLVMMTFEVTMLSGNAPIVISSQIVNHQDYDDIAQRAKPGVAKDPRRNQGLNHRVLIPQLNWHSQRRMILGYSTANSAMTMAVGADHSIETDNVFEQLEDTTADQGRKVYRIDAIEGQKIRITKAVAYHSSRNVPVRELSDRVRRTLDRVRVDGFDEHLRRHLEVVKKFWEKSDVEIGSTKRIQQAVRWCLFELLQASARADGLGVAAKGLTGDGYEGHYFWDTEVYVIPFLAYTNPVWARNLLRFRYTHLDLARERARELSTLGALFPWRTINGEEASAYYAAGTAQYHIDADVAYAVGHYWKVTGDREFVYAQGATVLIETARMWAELGFWRSTDQKESFEIHGVTGPDEYTTVVNNNTYTNVMARHNLRLAVDVVNEIRANSPEDFKRLAHSLDLSDAELREWARCADGMKIPFNEEMGIHPQDDNFLNKELWDLENTPREGFPLLLHYHPLVIYRFQVLKQADVVLAIFLRGDDFTAEQKRADFEYYDPITTGDSSLSAVMQATVAAEVGHQRMAYQYFLHGLFVDLADLHKNTADGVHIASAGGVWHALVQGFGGMRYDDRGFLSFDPRLPRRWGHLAFFVTFRGTRLKVTLTASAISFEIIEGAPIQVIVRDNSYQLSDSQITTVALENQGIRLPNLATQHPVIGGRRPDGSLINAEVPETPTEFLPRII